MLIGLYELNFDYLSTQDLAFEFLSEVPDEKLLNDTIKPISLNYGIGLETPYVEKILNRKADLDSTEFAEFYAASYSFNLDLASENKDTSLLNKILRVLIPYASGSDSLKHEMVLETQILFARESGLFEVWQSAVIEYCDSLGTADEKAEFAFDEAYAIAEDYNSESAQKAARALAAKASTWEPDYRYYMLESYMGYLMKDYDDALIVVDKALGISDNEKDTERAQRLRNMIVADKE
jgi:predicted RNase H-like nuclease